MRRITYEPDSTTIYSIWIAFECVWKCDMACSHVTWRFHTFKSHIWSTWVRMRHITYSWVLYHLTWRAHLKNATWRAQEWRDIFARDMTEPYVPSGMHVAMLMFACMHTKIYCNTLDHAASHCSMYTCMGSIIVLEFVYTDKYTYTLQHTTSYIRIYTYISTLQYKYVHGTRQRFDACLYAHTHTYMQTHALQDAALFICIWNASTCWHLP